MSIITDILHTVGLATKTELREIESLTIANQAHALQQAMRMMSRGYAAAENGRLTGDWVTATGNPLSDIRSGIKSVRDRARDLQANDPTGHHIISMWRMNVPGPKGFSFKCKATLNGSSSEDRAGNQAVERAYYDWSRKEHCSVSGTMSRRMIEHLVMAQLGRDGEFLVRKVYNKSKYGFQLQPLDVELLDESINQISGGNIIVMGVEIDKWGKPVAYHLRAPNASNRIYGYNTSGVRERVPADQVYHGFDINFACQTRGISLLAPIMLRMKALNDWERYQWVAAKANSALAIVFKDQTGTSTAPLTQTVGQVNPQKQVSMEFSEFMVQDIGKKDMVIDRAEFPNEMYGEYVRLMEQRIGSGVDFDYPHISGDLSQTNFSSARFGAATVQEAFRSLQNLLVEGFLDPMSADWLLMAMLKNQITLASGAVIPSERYEKFAAAITFTGRTWGFIQPMQDIMAAVLAMEYGLQSPIEWFEERGKDMYEVYNDIKAAKDLRAKLGIETKFEELDENINAIGATAEPGQSEKIQRAVRSLADVLLEIDAAEQSMDENALDAAQEKLIHQARTILKKQKNGHTQSS
jgi:lambda family phage portal protein